MRKDERKTSEPKGVYRVRNWLAYNAGLVERGNVTMWIDIDEPGGICGTQMRSAMHLPDAVIQMLLGLKQVFRLPLRGFAQSQRDLLSPVCPCPTTTEESPSGTGSPHLVPRPGY